MADRDQIFQRLCHEAVVACGTDIQAIERYVRGRIDAMNEADRQIVTRDRDCVPAFRAPTASSKTH